MAAINEQIARATGNGQTPNDLLDQREQVIREINQYVQTTQIPADDGTIGLFVGGSQPLVLGTTATEVAVGDSGTFPSSGQVKLLFTRPGSPAIELDENMLGGGSISGLLRFNNTDLAEGRNLLGRMALAIGTTLNYQQTLGLTLDGVAGKPLFATTPSVPGLTLGTAVGSISFTNSASFSPTKFAASDYEVRFDATGVGGQVVRLSDGETTPFTNIATLATTQIDGLTFNFTATGTANERVLFKPFGTAASDMKALVYSPRDLAVANPINAAMGTSNSGTLQLAGLQATGITWNGGTGQAVNSGIGGLSMPPSPVPPATTGGGVVLTFNASGQFTLSGNANPPIDMAANPPQLLAGPPYAYTSGQSIHIDGWSINLKGSPKAGDTVTIGNAKDAQYGDNYTRNAGNATALMNLRDVKMFDESTLSDGYASAMAQVGTRTQSALFASDLSKSIAVNLENDRTAVSGVNLDEEAAKLLQYQQAYQASAKMLQIAQSVFDTLIQNLGR